MWGCPCVWVGSPPHARGRPTKYKGEHNAHRITPACAGKTCGGCAPIRRPVDHPRMRGEDWLVFVSEQTLCGSPPHARGRRGLVGQGPADFWITPACAGKTWPRWTGPRRLLDHPRMRGEDDSVGELADHVAGSPPHARGRPHSHGPNHVWDKDHPRMRGEDRHAVNRDAKQPGSPPHARGRPDRARTQDMGLRITPACAGKTVNQSARDRSTPDHPRMRGEDLPGKKAGYYAHGSPPHARGRQPARRGSGKGQRITPACAGKTLPFLVRNV